MTNKDVQFTHYWVANFGWENTIFQPEDFVEVELLGLDKTDAPIFLAINEKGGKQIFKGSFIDPYGRNKSYK